MAAAEEPIIVSQDLVPYLNLLARFLSGEIPDPEFEDTYNELYMNDQSFWPHEIFNLLDGVFAEAEALVLDEELRPRIIGAIGPDELHAYVAKALERLRAIHAQAG